LDDTFEGTDDGSIYCTIKRSLKSGHIWNSSALLTSFDDMILEKIENVFKLLENIKCKKTTYI